ncbi:hypothetical protein D3C87_1311280 [compost metagenome]
MILFCCFYALPDIAPGHYRSIRGQSSFQYLIPANDLSTPGIDKLFNPLYKITLQFELIFELFFLNPLLAVFTGRPALFRAFISPNVDVGRREQRHDFGKYIFQKFKCVFLARTVNVLKYTPALSYFKRSRMISTSQFRIGRKRRNRMPWQFYFRNYSNLPFCSKSHNFLNLFLRIKTSVRKVVLSV